MLSLDILNIYWTVVNVHLNKVSVMCGQLCCCLNSSLRLGYLCSQLCIHGLLKLPRESHTIQAFKVLNEGLNNGEKKQSGPALTRRVSVALIYQTESPTSCSISSKHFTLTVAVSPTSCGISSKHFTLTVAVESTATVSVKCLEDILQEVGLSV